MILGLGVGIGCSISSSESKALSDGIIRTEYLRSVWGYNTGWRYDRHKDGGLYNLSFRFIRLDKEKKPGGLSRILPFITGGS